MRMRAVRSDVRRRDGPRPACRHPHPRQPLPSRSFAPRPEVRAAPARRGALPPAPYPPAGDLRSPAPLGCGRLSIPIHDNHFHCRPDGWKGLGAVREFMAAGGTSIAHVRLPTYPSTAEAFTRSCLEHIEFGEAIRRETGCTVYTVVGPYPLEPMRVAEAQGWDAALDFGRQCFDVAARLCERGKAACIGEVGRAHFDVPADVQARNNELLLYGMQRAADAGVPIMLHTEHAEPATMAEFAAMADRARLARG